MDRLTEPKRNDDGTAMAKKDLVVREGMLKGMPSNYCCHIVDKLADYEDLEDQGLLVKLPCKVGTTVYHIVTVDTENRKAIIEHEADLFFMVVATVEERWGKTVFLTEQEAEESLNKGALKMFDGFGNENDMPEWFVKCMTCTHAYTTKDDDEVKCRCKKGCDYKPYNPAKKRKESRKG